MGASFLKRAERAFFPAAAVIGLFGCTSEPPPGEQDAILGIAETETWGLAGLERSVYVVRTESNIPHIYATNRRDLARVQGFTIARDRFFMMDLQRRLGLGTISQLLGDAALEIDQESRGVGMTFLTDRILAGLSPEIAEVLDGFAAGINGYIDEVKADNLPPPSELKLAQGLLGVSNPTELMKPFERRDVAAMVSVVLYQTSYETGDVGRAATAAALATLFEGEAFQELRRAGAIEDLWQRIEPVKPYSSAAGLGLEQGNTARSYRSSSTAAKKLPPSMLERLSNTLTRRARWRTARDVDVGFGSNAWAVAGTHSQDGAALLAGDGHLSLAVPSILYQLGLDTSVFGRGDTHQLGLVIAGFPVMPIGTNGKVAWSQTQLMGDVTDWYVEEVQLTDGYPVASSFQGEWRGLAQYEEHYEIANVPALDSVGRSETWHHWETFDGRWIADIEGRSATPDEQLAEGESLVTMRGSYIVPGDTNDDGVVTAVSFDYAAFDLTALLSTTDAFGHANNVHEFREASRGLVAYSQNFAVADSDGSILYTSYQSVPCRSYLERNSDGSWAEDSDPNLLLDGTRYGGFTIATVDGKVDESFNDSDPYRCAVPFDDMPQALDPAAGFVATANNDPGNLSTDGSLTNDEWYIGGPWDTGFRADTIARALEDAIANDQADIAKMAEIQANTNSSLGALFVDLFLQSVDYARALDASPSDEADQRIKALFAAEQESIDETYQRLEAWRDGGFKAKSGVETFYQDVTSDDRDDAVATTLFNAWMGRVIRGVFDDEQLPGVFHPSGSHGRVRGLNRFLRGRGADNPQQLASFNPDTNESIFFDVLGTDELETSHEVVLGALVDAVIYLRSDPIEGTDGEGGFGTSDMSQWLWGLRHYVRFESLLGDFIGDDEDYSALTQQFAITSKQLPLAESLSSSDPRKALLWFPRDGDQFAVDAANSGLNGESFSYGSGPAMRMVVSLKGNEVRGINVVPGGQSALVDSPYFLDQAKLWLANDTVPMRFTVSDVVAGATGRETFRPR